MAEATSLSHLRVLELGGGAAAYAGHFLAELGADVIKVEPSGGEAGRAEPPFAGDVAGPERSLHFIYFNANKRSVVVDLGAPEGREAFLRLARTADILVEAYPPGHLKGLGVGYDRLREVAPRLVVVSVTAFGQTGPLAGYRGNNAVAEAMSGMIFPLGDDTRAPCVSPNEVLSQIAGMHGAFYALCGVHHCRRGGTGQHVEVSLQEVGTGMFTGLADYALRRVIRYRTGSSPLVGGATAIYRVQDGYVKMQPGQPNMWRSLVAWMQEPALSGPEWEGREYRDQNQDVIHMLVAAFASGFTREEFVREAQARGLPTSPVQTVREMVESPDVAALGSFVERSHPTIGVYKVVDFARMGGSPVRFRRPAPAVGEHQEEVLQETVARPRPSAQVPGGGSAASPRRPCLEGVRVLDFTRVIAGPSGTQLLAFLGADVIKVESAELAGAAREPTANFPDINRGKRSVTLDVRRPEGRDLALRLAARSDVVVNNFSAHVMDRLGLGYEAMRQARPEIIYVAMPGMGRKGPLSDWVAYGQTPQSYSGLVYLWRDPATPLEAGVKGPVTDYIAAANLALTILAALEYRDRTGRGQFIDLPMLEGVAHTVGAFYMDYLVNGRDPQPQGYRSARNAPYGCYPCRGDDVWCVIACETEEEWRAFGKAIGEPGWVEDARFGTKAGRMEHRDELDRLIGTWTRQYTARQVMHFLQTAGVPAGMVQGAEELFYDYHLRARGHLVTVPHPAPWGPFDHQGLPGRFSETPGNDTVPAPTLGQHNAEVLGGLLGLSPAELRSLQEARVVH